MNFFKKSNSQANRDSEGKNPTLIAGCSNLIINREVIQVNPSKESNGCTQPYQHNRVYSAEGLMIALDTDKRKDVLTNHRIRRLTPTECERLQTVPDGFTAHVSESQRYRMLGNGWTVDVIAHIFSYISKTTTLEIVRL